MLDTNDLVAKMSQILKRHLSDTEQGLPGTSCLSLFLLTDDMTKIQRSERFVSD